jgi:hypothetical protein
MYCIIVIDILLSLTLRKVLGPERDEVTGVWRRLHDE